MNTQDKRELNLSEPQGAVYYARTPLVLDMAGQGLVKRKILGCKVPK